MNGTRCFIGVEFLVAAHALGSEIERVCELKDQQRARIQRGLGMVHKQMHGDCAGTDQTTCQCSCRAGYNGAYYYAGAYCATVFNAVPLDAGVGADGAFVAYAGVGTVGAGDLSMDGEMCPVGQRDSFRLSISEPAGMRTWPPCNTS